MSQDNSDILNKKHELSALEEKQNQLKEITNDVSLIINKLKKDIDISKEDELFRKKEELEKKVESQKNELGEKNKLIKDLKDTNMALIYELKAEKAKNIENITFSFEKTFKNKISEDFKKEFKEKLQAYQYKILVKINNLKKILPKSNAAKAGDIKNKLADIENEVNILVKDEEAKIFDSQSIIEKDLLEFATDTAKEFSEKAKNSNLMEKEKKNFIMERIVGQKGFQILGLISIFVALIILFKDQFHRLFNGRYGKSIVAYLLGMIFLLLGEYLYKKEKKTFATGMIGGGIGVLYLATILSSTYLKLYSLKTGLGLAIILTVLSIVLSLKYNSQMIGIMALIGGYIPYSTCIGLQENIGILYLSAYSLIFQLAVLAVSWSKNWKALRITGFIIGAINTIFMMNYMYKSNINIYIILIFVVMFTTMYTYVFLIGAEHENRKEKKTDYLFLGINLILKFVSVTVLTIILKTSIYEKAGIFLVIGFLYAVLGDRLKKYALSQTFNFMGLAAFTIVVPILAPNGYIPIAWGLEALLIYTLSVKTKNENLTAGTLILYFITIIENIPVIMAHHYMKFDYRPWIIRHKLLRLETFDVNEIVYYADQIVVILLSFAVYNYIIKNKPKKLKGAFELILKYATLTFSIYTFRNLSFRVLEKIFVNSIRFKYFHYMLFATLVTFAVIFVLRKCTYKFKKYYDKLSILYIVIIEGITHLYLYLSLPILGHLNYSEDPIRYGYSGISNPSFNYKLIIIEIIFTVILVGYLIFICRLDLHKAIFKDSPRNMGWIIGEVIYIITIAIWILDIYKIPRRALIFDTLGLVICIVFVWKGFKLPNKNMRRIGLAIGLLFTAKGVIIDFARLQSYRVVGYFITGFLLLVTSAIYQNALKKLDVTERNVNNLDSSNDEIEENLEEKEK
ncbi:MAG: DUF2339 domain-containing protein [Fusobacteriaceae bacterium]|jgi:hypothetical protein|nr:DUF2339 domain-containing protein [Fusobacteriaceae bacterium]